MARSTHQHPVHERLDDGVGTLGVLGRLSGPSTAEQLVDLSVGAVVKGIRQRHPGGQGHWLAGHRRWCLSFIAM